MRRNALAAVVTFATLLLSAWTPEATAQERPFTQGPVIQVSFVRTKPGMFLRYMQYLQGDYKEIMEAAKAEGIILDYAILSSPRTSLEDHDLVLTVTYPNMASLDGLLERMDPIQARVTSLNLEQRAQANADREAMRENVGSRIYRVLQLK